MALKNSQGWYLKVKRVNVYNNIVYYEVYRNQEVRNNITEFDATVENSLPCANFEKYCTDFTSTGNLFSDIKAIAYRALKHEPPFNGATGETWEDC